MHITCPSCSATFMTEAERFQGAARRVRCGRCGHVWRELPEGEAAAIPAGAVPPVDPAPAGSAFPQDPQAAPPRHPQAAPRDPGPESGPARGRQELYTEQPRRRGGSGFGWILFVVVVAGLVAAAWIFRQEIVAEVPEAAEIYRKLNIPIEARVDGLEISGVTSVRRTVAGERRLVVSGSVVNVSQQPQRIPMLRAVVTDAQGEVVTTWEFAAASRRLDPGSTATFESSTANPPADSTLEVDFAGDR